MISVLKNNILSQFQCFSLIIIQQSYHCESVTVKHYDASCTNCSTINTFKKHLSSELESEAVKFKGSQL